MSGSIQHAVTVLGIVPGKLVFIIANVWRAIETEDLRRRTCLGFPTSFRPSQELCQRVGLIVMPSGRKAKDFPLEDSKPWGILRQDDLTRLDLWRLGQEALQLAAFRFACNRSRNMRLVLMAKLLDQLLTGGGIFDQQALDVPPVDKLFEPSLQIRKRQPGAKHIKDVEKPPSFQGSDADRSVIVEVVLGCGVPALDDQVTWLSDGFRGTASEPPALYCLSIGRDRCVLILCTEPHRPHHGPLRLKLLTILALGVQDIANLARLLFAMSKRDHFIGFGDRGQAQMLPAAGFHEVSCEIILVQPLHDKDHRPGLFVIESRRKGAALPVFDRFPRNRRRRLFGVDRVIDDDVTAKAGHGAADRC